MEKSEEQKRLSNEKNVTIQPKYNENSLDNETKRKNDEQNTMELHDDQYKNVDVIVNNNEMVPEVLNNKQNEQNGVKIKEKINESDDKKILIGGDGGVKIKNTNNKSKKRGSKNTNKVLREILKKLSYTLKKQK